MVAAQHGVPLALGVEHAAGRESRVPDLPRAQDHQTAFSRLAAAIHIAVANSPPLMRVTLFLDNSAVLIDPSRTKKARNVEYVGQPIDVNREVAFELVGEILRQVGVGALVVDVGCDGSWFSHAGLLSWYLPLGYNASSFRRSCITEAPDGERTPDRDQQHRLFPAWLRLRARRYAAAL